MVSVRQNCRPRSTRQHCANSPKLHAIQSLDELRVPPGNRFERLLGNRKGQHSIRVNDQFRVCFRWDGQNVRDVEIVDYH